MMIWLMLGAILFGGACLYAGAMSSRPAGTKQTSVVAVKSREVLGLNRAQLQKMLQRVATTKPPTPKMGAMCYDMATPPNRAEYVCPTCGEKTLYIEQQAYRVSWEVETCRRLIKEIANRAVTLDESAWCKKCRPDVNEPALALHLRFDDGTARSVEKVNTEQLRLLRDFLGGKLAIKGEQDMETPLKEKLDELEKLLGEKAGAP